MKLLVIYNEKNQQKINHVHLYLSENPAYYIINLCYFNELGQVKEVKIYVHKLVTTRFKDKTAMSLTVSVMSSISGAVPLTTSELNLYVV